MRRELVTKSTSGGCGQFETSPEAIELEIRTALCERRQTDRLKTNYRIDDSVSVYQTRHNFVGEIRIFSVKIRINPYPLFMHRCIAKRSRDSYRDAVCKKISTWCIINRQPAAKNKNRSFISRGSTVGLASVMIRSKPLLPF